MTSFFLLALFSCNDNHNLEKEINAYDHQILVTHDEVMPKIGKVLLLRKQINNKLDSCKDENCKEVYQEAYYQLTKADADMMNWMHHYQKPSGNDTAIAYLKQQLEVIEKVKVQILSSILVADSLLN